MKRRETISRLYPDINSLKEAPLEELAQILPYDVAEDLYNKLHN